MSSSLTYATLLHTHFCSQAIPSVKEGQPQPPSRTLIRIFDGCSSSKKLGKTSFYGYLHSIFLSFRQNFSLVEFEFRGQTQKNLTQKLLKNFELFRVLCIALTTIRSPCETKAFYHTLDACICIPSQIA